MLILQSYPVWLRSMSAGRYVDLALAHSLGAGSIPDITCAFNRVDGSGSRRDFFVGCPNALAASQACYVTDRWFTPRFSLIAHFRIDAWIADVSCPVACMPLWPACWLDTPDRSSSSSSRVVQDVWDVYRDVLGVVPGEVVLSLRDAATRSAIDDFWSIWSKNAEAGLFRAYTLAGGPVTGDNSVFLGRGSLRIRHRRLGGKAVGGGSSSSCIVFLKVMRLTVTVPSFLSTPLFLLCFSFVNVLSLLLMFLRVFGVKGLPSLDGILWLGIGRGYVVMVLAVPFLLFTLGIIGFLLICMVFYRWVFDALDVLNRFFRQVVVSRRDEGIRRWKGWLSEDLSSRPYIWLRPDFVPPSPFLVVKDSQTRSSRVVVEPHLIDAEFRKAWMPYFCRSGHPEVSAEQFLGFIGHFLPQQNFLDLPRITHWS